MTTDVLKMCKEVESNVETEIQKLKWIAITVDGWTSTASDSYVMITGHWLTENFEMKQATLAVRPLRVRHTGVNLRDTVKQVLTKLKFSGSIINEKLRSKTRTIKIDGKKKKNKQKKTNDVAKPPFCSGTCLRHVSSIHFPAGIRVTKLKVTGSRGKSDDGSRSREKFC